MNKRKIKFKTGQYYFFLNPYKNCAFSRCPKCDHDTRIRKFPLVVYVEPNQILLINKKCRYCIKCDLIITKKEELESMMVMSIENQRPDVIGNDYVTVGVLSKENWLKGNKGEFDSTELLERVEVFKDVLNFELLPAWVKAD
jgi:hypothetical protein